MQRKWIPASRISILSGVSHPQPGSSRQADVSLSQISKSSMMKMALRKVTLKNGSSAYSISKNISNSWHSRSRCKNSITSYVGDKTSDTPHVHNGLQEQLPLKKMKVNHMNESCDEEMPMDLSSNGTSDPNGGINTSGAVDVRNNNTSFSPEIEPLKSDQLTQNGVTSPLEGPEELEQIPAQYLKLMKKRLLLVRFWPLAVNFGQKNPLDEAIFKGYNFFPDAQMNQQLTKLLTKVNFATAIYLTAFVFFGIESFKKYYLPIDDDPLLLPEETRQPQPMHKYFRSFLKSLQLDRKTTKLNRLTTQVNRQFRIVKSKPIRWLWSLEEINKDYFKGREDPFDIFDFFQKKRQSAMHFTLDPPIPGQLVDLHRE